MPVDRQKEYKILLCCNKEIEIVDSLPLNEIDHKLDSDSDSGWEYDVNDLVEMIEEMKVGEYIQMEAEMEMEMEAEMKKEMEMEMEES